jgi:hypothetical protein
MRKASFLTLFLTFLLTLPVLAQLGQIWTDFQYYSSDLQNYLNNHLKDTLSPLETQAQTAILSATGELHIPNPVVAGQKVYDDLVISSISDRFDNNSVVRSTLVGSEINRLITFSSVAGFLGNNGQSRLKNKLQNTEISLKNIAEFSRESDELLNEIKQIVSSVSGIATIPPFLTAKLNTNQADLQLQSIKIQSEQAGMMAENLYQTIQMNQFLQYSNLNLANISQQIEETNRTRRLDNATEAARLLRATAQMDLLGRKIKN